MKFFKPLLKKGLSALMGSFSPALGSLTNHFLSNLLKKKNPSLPSYGHHTQTPDVSVLPPPNLHYARFGEVIPLIYGRYKIKAPIIWSSMPIKNERLYQTTSGKQSKKTYHVMHFALGLAQGCLQSVERIWANHELIYDQRYQNQTFFQKNFMGNMRFYTGSETQYPDSLIEQIEGKGNVPGFRGLSYLVFENFSLEDYANHLPHFTVEVTAACEKKTILFDHSVPYLESEFFVLSYCDAYIYSFEKKIFTRIERFEKEGYHQYEIALPENDLQSSDFCGFPIEDIETGNIYAFCKNSISSFIIVLDPFMGKIIQHNYRDKQIGTFYLGIIYQEYLVISDYSNGSIYFYNRHHLACDCILKVDNESNLTHTRFTPFVIDEQDQLWVGYYSTEKDHFFTILNFKNMSISYRYRVEGYGQPAGLFYDHDRKGFFIATSCHLLFFDIFLEKLHVVHENISSHTATISFYYNQFIQQDILWTTNNHAFFKIHTRSHEILETVEIPSSLPHSLAKIYDPILDAFWLKTHKINCFLYNRTLSTNVQLADIIEDICRKIKCNAFMHLSSQTPVEGLGVYGLNAKKVFEILQQSYFFLCYEKEECLHFTHSFSEDPVKVISADLGAAHQDQQSYVLHEKRQNAHHIPTILSFTYPSVNRDYHAHCQMAETFKHNAKELKISTPLLLTDTQAKQIAEKNLFLLHLKKNFYQITLPVKYLYLHSGMCINLKNRFYLVEDITWGANNILEVTLTPHQDHVYISHKMGISVDTQKTTDKKSVTLYTAILPEKKTPCLFLLSQFYPIKEGWVVNQDNIIMKEFSSDDLLPYGQIHHMEEKNIYIRLIRGTFSLQKESIFYILIDKKIISCEKVTKIKKNLYCFSLKTIFENIAEEKDIFIIPSSQIIELPLDQTYFVQYKTKNNKQPIGEIYDIH